MASLLGRKVVSTSMIGLDIGSSAVRAAEITRARGRRGLTLRRFGQTALPNGAVVDGEIRDPGAVATALRQLWSDTGFGSRNVVLAVSGQRVIVRQAEVPSMSEGDFRSALKFQAMDLIPLPVDDALLDFVILPPLPGEPKQTDQMQILLAAAHRGVIDSNLRVLREAALHPVALDPASAAIIRATERISATEDVTVAIVDVGADLTVIAVRAGGRVRFSRILNRGGADLTARLATRSTIPPDEAESIKQRASDNGGSGSLSTADVDPLVSEIEGSLAFFSDQMGADRLGDVLLTGAGAQSPEFLGQMTRRLSGSVRVLDALGGLDYAALGLGVEGLEAASWTALVAVGAAEWAFDQPSRRLSLLPPEVAQAAAARRRVFATAAGVALLAASLTGLTLTRAHQTAAIRKETVAVQATNQTTQTRITELTPLSNVLIAVQARLSQETADGADDIAWSSLVQEVSAALPAGTTLTSLSMTDGQTGGASATPGSLTMSVKAQGTEEEVAVWLRAFAHLPGISAVSVPSGSASDGVVTFSSSATLTTGVPLVSRAATTGPGS
jgi:type IV pilus assembly protein PilM